MKLFFLKSRQNPSEIFSYDGIYYLVNMFAIWKTNNKNV